MTTISLTVPTEMVSLIDEIARSRKMSRSALLREALEEKLNTTSRKYAPSLYDLSTDLCGRGNSGHGDLASNPRHLEGFGL